MIYTNSLKNIYRQKNIKNSLNIILSIVTSLTLISLAIRPTLSTITSLKKQLSDENQVLRLLQQKIQALQSAEKNYYQAQPYFSYIESAIPEKAETALFNIQLNYLAQKHNISIESINFGSFNLIDKMPPDKKQIAEKQNIPINVNFNGSWDNIKNFMSDLENLSSLIKIKQSSLASSQKDTTQLINVSLQGEIYYFPNKGNL